MSNPHNAPESKEETGRQRVDRCNKLSAEGCWLTIDDIINNTTGVDLHGELTRDLH